MKSLLALGLILTLVSCAEKNPNHKKNPLQELRNLQMPTGLAVPQSAKEPISVPSSIKTMNLELNFAQESLEAQLIIKGPGAMALYDVLKINAVDQRKAGTHLSCEKNEKRAQCLLTLVYANGEVTPVIEPGEENGKVANLAKDLNAGPIQLRKAKGKSTIELEDVIAFVLYSEMKVGEKDGELLDGIQTFIKEGQNYSCTKTSRPNADDQFKCLLRLDHKSGTLL